MGRGRLAGRSSGSGRLHGAARRLDGCTQLQQAAASHNFLALAEFESLRLLNSNPIQTLLQGLLSEAEEEAAAAAVLREKVSDMQQALDTANQVSRAAGWVFLSFVTNPTVIAMFYHDQLNT